ncbi:MAG: alpha/beta fold hydrolase [bacterium]
MLSATVNGLKIAYHRAGEGPPLLLLHGFIQDSRYWRPQIEDLSRDFSVIACDIPGCGGSGDPPTRWGMPDFADCLAAFLRAIDAAPVHIVGLSWGGILAQELYRRHWEAVRSLVLADTYAGWKGSLPQEAVAERIARCERDCLRPPDEWVPGWMPELLTAQAPEELRRDVLAMMSDLHPVGYRIMTHALAHCDTRDVLPAIAVPALLVWGAEDGRSPVSVGEAMQQRIPGAKMIVIENAGHLSSAEQPELFNAAVLDFLHSVEVLPSPAT